MTTSVTVQTNAHRIRVDSYTNINDKTIISSEEIEPNTERTLYVHKNLALMISEIDPTA